MVDSRVNALHAGLAPDENIVAAVYSPVGGNTFAVGDCGEVCPPAVVGFWEVHLDEAEKPGESLTPFLVRDVVLSGAERVQ